MKQRGVTLIQMMFALGLLALLAQLGMTAYSKMSRELQQEAAAKNLVQALRTARSEALLRNQVVLLQAHEGGWGYGWRMLLEQRENALFREFSANGRVKISGNGPVAARVRFNGLGVPLRESGAFLSGALHVCGEPGQKSVYQIVLSPTGRVSLHHAPTDKPLCPA